MDSADLGALTLAVLALLVLGAVRLLGRRFHRDRIFASVPPGVIPPPGQGGDEKRVQGGQEYSGVIPVAFGPPRGLTPGIVGTVVDGSADPRDITASIVDLAARGWLTITAIGPDGRPITEAGVKPKDWQLNASGKAPQDRVTDFEAALLDALFASGNRPEVRMSELTRSGDRRLYAVRDSLYDQVVRLGWYPKRPNARTSAGGCLFVGLGVLAFLALAAIRSPIGIVSGIVAGVAIALIPRMVNRRVPRTALGTAVRIQSLGFKQYLATAEADQFKFEEAAGIFSRYLPYAIVFGVAQHWAKVFQDLAAQAQIEGYGDLGFDLDWFSTWVILDTMSDLSQLAVMGDLGALGDLASIGDMADFADMAMSSGLGDIGDAVSGVGDFVSSIDLGDFGDFGGFDF